MYDEMAEQIFPSVYSSRGLSQTPGHPGGKRRRHVEDYGGVFGLSPLVGSGLPFLAPYAPGVSGMRMVGTGGIPGYGGLTTGMMFGQ